jgi:hypothetical protein
MNRRFNQRLGFGYGLVGQALEVILGHQAFCGDTSASQRQQ